MEEKKNLLSVQILFEYKSLGQRLGFSIPNYISPPRRLFWHNNENAPFNVDLYCNNEEILYKISLKTQVYNV